MHTTRWGTVRPHSGHNQGPHAPAPPPRADLSFPITPHPSPLPKMRHCCITCCHIGCVRARCLVASARRFSTSTQCYHSSSTSPTFHGVRCGWCCTSCVCSSSSSRSRALRVLTYVYVRVCVYICVRVCGSAAMRGCCLGLRLSPPLAPPVKDVLPQVLTPHPSHFSTSLPHSFAPRAPQDLKRAAPTP